MEDSRLLKIIVKKCPCCGQQFSFNDLLKQPYIEPKGITFYDNKPEMNMFFFNHVCENCNTTFAIPAKDFTGFLTEDVPDKVLAGLPECEKRCLDINDKNEFTQNCQWAPFRRFIIQLIDEKEKLKKSVIEVE